MLLLDIFMLLLDIFHFILCEELLLWALYIGYMVKFKSHTIQSELSVLHCTAGDDFSLHAACRMREVVTHNSLHETQTAAFLFSFGGVLVMSGLYYFNVMNFLYYFVCRFCNNTFMTCVNVYVPGSVHITLMFMLCLCIKAWICTFSSVKYFNSRLILKGRWSRVCLFTVCSLSLIHISEPTRPP